MNQKNCAIPIAPVAVNNAASESTQATAQTQPSKEVRLAELKRLHDANLITKEVYAERQKAILESVSN